MKLPPADVLATWPKPNYVNPVTRGNALLIVNIVFIPLSFLVVSLRIFTRLRITGSFGVDDGLIVVSMVSSTPPLKMYRCSRVIDRASSSAPLPCAS